MVSGDQIIALELEGKLRRKVGDLNIVGGVVFRGFIQTNEVCRTLANTLPLILLSNEEQYGNTVMELQALNNILSSKYGARVLLARSGVNGFVVEADKPIGWAFFMSLLLRDEALRRRMYLAARDFSGRAT